MAGHAKPFVPVGVGVDGKPSYDPPAQPVPAVAQESGLSRALNGFGRTIKGNREAILWFSLGFLAGTSWSAWRRKREARRNARAEQRNPTGIAKRAVQGASDPA
ncbi:MAG: hypothetical protein Q8R92_17935 [Deltaproteobacteria bacterium]|nr:hypothetical protein [Deltaproteobacteria bacterium]